MRSFLLASMLCLGIASSAPAQNDDAGLPSADDYLAETTRSDGFVSFAWDGRRGRLLLEVDSFGTEFLWVGSVASGLGSNPVGLDRGSIGPREVVEFRRVGPRVLLVAKNLRFRASSESEDERRSVDESFADSVLAGFDVLAETDGRVVLDATRFLMQDAVGAARKVRSQDGVTYSVDSDRSAVYVPGCKAFPKNTELEVSLTLSTSGSAGREVSSVAAVGSAFTVRQRHSFVELPEPWKPRVADPRVGFFGTSFRDYAVPLSAPMDLRYIARHRLEKDASGQIVEPIVYYVDRGAPEPVRSALVEGASWWAEAFADAGFPGGFRVEVLPEGVDPLDLRYNVVHWVHRATRGWSYGASVTDPRTGEILKGSVLLGSLRVRQDLLLLKGLAARMAGSKGSCAAGLGPAAGHLLATDDARREEVALARIRQLAAHELGHTLGLSHNFAASSYGRASVMDYPAPWVRLRGGELDFSEAYDVGIGEYDRFAIRYGYTQFEAGTNERSGLEAIVREGLADGFIYLTDQDARAPGTMHPIASLWDNGEDALDELRSVLAVQDRALIDLRDRALLQNQVRPGAPMADLEASLVPTMLHWRYQALAAAKLIGGVDYRHAVRGDGQPMPERVPADRQREAIDLLVSLLDPARLTVPEPLQDRIPPPAPGDPGSIERFDRAAGAMLQVEDIARAGAELVLDFLLSSSRVDRLAVQVSGPDLEEMVGRLLEQTLFDARATTDAEHRVARAVWFVVVSRLGELVESPSIEPVAVAQLRAAVRSAAARASTTSVAAEDSASWSLVVDHLKSLESSRGAGGSRSRPEVPPGQPIGQPARSLRRGDVRDR